MKRSIVVFVFLGLVMGLGVSAAGKVFTSLTVSNSYDYSQLPSNATSPDGLIMTVWCETAAYEQNQIQARIFNTKTNTLGPVLEIAGQFGDNIWPRIAAGDAGEFMVVWSNNPGGMGEHFHDIRYALYRNGKFGPAKDVYWGNSMFPNVCYDQKNAIFSVFWELFLPGVVNVVEQRYKNDRWLDWENVSNLSLSGGHVQVAVDDNGVRYAAWQQKTAIEPREIIEVAYSHTRSGTWMSTPIILTADNAWRQVPNVAVSPDGKEVLVKWMNSSARAHYGQYIQYEGNKTTYGPIHEIAPGPSDITQINLLSGLVYHGDRFYFTYTDGRVNLSSFYRGKWTDESIIPKTLNPNIADMSSSPYVGLAISWMNDGEKQPNGDLRPEVYMAYYKYPVASFWKITSVQGLSLTEVRESSIFFVNNSDVVEWRNNEENFVDGVNKAVGFLLYRVDQGTRFNFTVPPYKVIEVATPADGYEIIEAGHQFRYSEKLPQADASKRYRYAIIAVDAEGNKSAAVASPFEEVSN